MWRSSISEHQEFTSRAALNFELRAMCHQKDPTFFLLAFTLRPPLLPTFTPWPPIFNKFLVTEGPWRIQRPSFSHLIVKQVTIFRKKLVFSKISTNLTKCWEIFGNFGPENPYFLMHFTEIPAIFVRFVTERPPFWRNFSPKDPYIWGAWWYSYVTFICECPGFTLA